MPKSPLVQDSVNTLHTLGANESALVQVREGNDPVQVDGVKVLLAAALSGYQAPIAPVALVNGNMFNATGASNHVQTTWYENTTSVIVRVVLRFGTDGSFAFSSNGFEHFGMASCLNGESTGVITNNQSSFFYSGASTETAEPLGFASGIYYDSGQFNGHINSNTLWTAYTDVAGFQNMIVGDPFPAPLGLEVFFNVLPGHDFRTMFQNYTSNGANNVLGVSEFEVLGSDVIGTTLGGSGDWSTFTLAEGSTIQGGQYIVTEYDT